MIRGPYLIFLGEVTESLFAKTACGVLDWAPELCRAQLRLSDDAIDLGLTDMGVGQAADAGLQTLVVGVASLGGGWSDSWREVFSEALEAGLDIASGMHERLNDDEALRHQAEACGRRLIDLRDPPEKIPVGSGKIRTGRRLLTVGTDCAVGKKYTALSIWKGLRERSIAADFCATGQTGVLISGKGFAIDAVVSDFIAGAAEILSPANDRQHWDIIEGQGSLFHPAYAGVSLGLLHGSQPEAIVLCHEAGREEIGFYPGYKTPSLEKAIARNIEAAKLTSPDVYCAGVSVNTAFLSEQDAERYLGEVSDQLNLPVIDPIRTGPASILERLLEA